jgi:hypothetical protein
MTRWGAAAALALVVTVNARVSADQARGGRSGGPPSSNGAVQADGGHVGAVEEFRGYYQHLDLAAGPHLIEIVAPDYEPLIVEVMIAPGRTTTYRRTLTRAFAR